MLVMSAILAALIAVLPAAFALRSGRQILALEDDPTLAERLVAHRRRNRFVTGAGGALLAVIAFKHLVWALPVLVLTRLATSYSLRKQLNRETWSFGGYVSFFTRLTLAVFGFWVLLGMVPWLVSRAEPYGWAAAGFYAFVLLAWSGAYNTVFRTLLRARPVDDPELVARFSKMLAQCSLPAVRLDQVDLRGGVFANAVALPGIKRPAVVVSSTLVERLRDETAAILAHELAHIEHFNPRRLRWIYVERYALIAAGALMAPVIRLAAPNAMALLSLWPVVLLASIVLRARQRQAHETASDVRAIALAGSADALIRALSRLHAFAHVPRRWDREWERHASHPSLARRIQAIRAASGMPPAVLGQAATFSPADDSSSATFLDDRLLWREGPSTEYSIDYRWLTMLRVDARGAGAAHLVAVDAEHRRWDMLLRREDVARVQATLDIVDTRLAAAAPPPRVMRPLPRVLALMALTLAATNHQLAVAIVGALTVAWPLTPVTAAMALASLGGTVLNWRDHGLWMNDSQHWTALALLACGVGLAAVTVANRQERMPPLVSKLSEVLASLFLATCAAVVFAGGDAIDLHRVAHGWPSASILVLALAGALSVEKRRPHRYASAALALAGLASVYLGSPGFLDRFVTDPFIAPAPAITAHTISPVPFAEMSVPFEVSSLRVSPTGRTIAVGSEGENDETTIRAGRVGGPLATFSADEATFLDDRRVLLLERLPAATRLRLVDLAQAGDDVWSLNVPVQRARFTFDRTSQRWSLLGWSASGEIASATGLVGQETVDDLVWKAPPSSDVALIASSSSEVLALERKTYRSRFGAGPHTVSVIWAITDGGSSVWTTTRLELRCGRLSTQGEAALCTAFDGSRTRIFEMNPVARRLKALVSIEGRFFRRGEDGNGWIVGGSSLGSVLLHTATGTAIRIDRHDGSIVDQFAIGDTVIAAAFSKENGSTVRLYDREKIGVPLR
jgi:Zn-dependent protease with chaperone function